MDQPDIDPMDHLMVMFMDSSDPKWLVGHIVAAAGRAGLIQLQRDDAPGVDEIWDLLRRNVVAVVANAIDAMEAQWREAADAGSFTKDIQQDIDNIEELLG